MKKPIYVINAVTALACFTIIFFVFYVYNDSVDTHGKFVMTMAFFAIVLIKLVAAEMYLLELNSSKFKKYCFTIIMFAGWASYTLLSGMMLSDLLAADDGSKFVKYFGFSVPIFLNFINLICVISIVQIKSKQHTLSYN